MNKVRGYMVEYSTGSYDDYHVHQDSVFLNKEDAENRVKSLCDLFHPEELFIKNDPDAEHFTVGSYYAMYDEVQDIMSKNPDYYYNNEAYYKLDLDKNDKWFERQEVCDKLEENLLMEVIRKYYPNWSDEQIMEARKRHDDIESYTTWDYSDPYITEIDVYLND